MMNKVRVRLRRLWNNLASLRDYNVEDYIRNNKTVILTSKIGYKDETMTLTPQDLKKGFDATLQKHKSKFNSSQKYNLVDFRWKPDKESKSNEIQEELF